MLCLFFVPGASDIEAGGQSVFVMERDSVTLHTDVTINQQDRIKWYFNDTRIAQIKGDFSYMCTDKQCAGRFRGRLQLDHQTGALTIMNFRTTDSGVYKLQIISRRISQKTFNISVQAASGAETDKTNTKSVKEGESVTLDPGIIKNPNDLLTWDFNNILIAEINGGLGDICTDDQCKERFRNRLKVNHQTGSLIITNIRTTDSGLYKLQINSSIRHHQGISNISIRRFSIRKFSITVTAHSSYDEKKQSLTLAMYTDLTVTNLPVLVIRDNQAQPRTALSGSQWRFYTELLPGRDRSPMPKTATAGSTYTSFTHVKKKRQQYTGCGALHKNELKLSEYKPHGVSGAETQGESVFVMEGDTVTLHTDVTINQRHRMKWYFNDTRIAQIKGDLSYICTDKQCDQRFRDRLKLDHQTGALTITNIRTTDAGVYKLQIIRKRIGQKIFHVAVRGVPAIEQDKMRRKIVKEGESVILDPDAEERFRGRLKVNHVSGSLTITNTKITDSGQYKLKIVHSIRRLYSISTIRIRRLSVTVIELGPSSGLIAGICAAAVVVLLVFASLPERCFFWFKTVRVCRKTHLIFSSKFKNRTSLQKYRPSVYKVNVQRRSNAFLKR
ncbi:Junctional adhesion molecule C [Labeo rohita]|uniref:Junctional adhesion molecule C n=1 Tax=Labeo rohita TaxID=84645 RepID=A0ABQ8LJ35_LABRO|nr:Junctional adhesion molecule C [Labeo rohita]